MANEAFAHAALEAGVRVVAGYPGTPSSELVETVAKLRAAGAAHGVHVEWSTNEKAALELVAGASYAGARVLFTCKQVGLNVASDALMSLNYVGVKGGCVLFVADDPGPISSQTEQDTRRFAAFAKVPVLDPATPEQGFAMMKEAFELSERHGTPVIVRPTTRICHASAFFDVAEETFAREVPEAGFERSPRWVIFPKRSYEAHGEIEDRLAAIALEAEGDGPLAAFSSLESFGVAQEAHLGILAGGVSAAYARDAIELLRTRAEMAGLALPACRFMQAGLAYPLPTGAVARFADGLDDVLVLEELDYTLEDELYRIAGEVGGTWHVAGKLTGQARERGENDVDDIARRIAEFFASADDGFADALAAVAAERGGEAAVDPASVLAEPAVEAFDGQLPVRPPVLCAGCPHRGSFYAVKKALGKTPAVLCGDIGCYTLGNAKPLDAVDTCLCMGAGITMAQGLAVADPGKKCLAFVGDSTFFASGLTGVANAVYNGHDVTVCVLDNATTAMTGAQPHPGTGVTLMGERRDPISIPRVLKALGVTCIEQANPLRLDEAIAAAKRAIAFEGPSAVIFQSPCIQLAKPEAPFAVDAGSCTGCKRCIGEIGCPAIGFDDGAAGPKSGGRGQAFVDATLCVGCGLCETVCPFRALGAAAASSADAGKGDGRDA